MHREERERGHAGGRTDGRTYLGQMLPGLGCHVPAPRGPAGERLSGLTRPSVPPREEGRGGEGAERDRPRALTWWQKPQRRALPARPRGRDAGLRLAGSRRGRRGGAAPGSPSPPPAAAPRLRRRLGPGPGPPSPSGGGPGGAAPRPPLPLFPSLLPAAAARRLFLWLSCTGAGAALLSADGGEKPQVVLFLGCGK